MSSIILEAWNELLIKAATTETSSVPGTLPCARASGNPQRGMGRRCFSPHMIDEIPNRLNVFKVKCLENEELTF